MTFHEPMVFESTSLFCMVLSSSIRKVYPEFTFFCCTAASGLNGQLSPLLESNNPAVQQAAESIAEQGISALGQLAEQGLQGLLGMMTGGGGGQQGVLDAP